MLGVPRILSACVNRSLRGWGQSRSQERIDQALDLCSVLRTHRQQPGDFDVMRVDVGGVVRLNTRTGRAGRWPTAPAFTVIRLSATDT